MTYCELLGFFCNKAAGDRACHRYFTGVLLYGAQPCIFLVQMMQIWWVPKEWWLLDNRGCLDITSPLLMREAAWLSDMLGRAPWVPFVPSGELEVLTGDFSFYLHPVTGAFSALVWSTRTWLLSSSSVHKEAMTSHSRHCSDSGDTSSTWVSAFFATYGFEMGWNGLGSIMAHYFFSCHLILEILLYKKKK